MYPRPTVRGVSSPAGAGDCAAAPALFYAETLVRFPAECGNLRGYYERLLQRSSVMRVLEEAKPFFKYYPGRETLPEPYRTAALG